MSLEVTWAPLLRRSFGLVMLLLAPVVLAQSVDRELAGQPLDSGAFVLAHQRSGSILLQHNADSVQSIASITKLMTAMVVLDAGQSLSETLLINAGDIDRLKNTRSRLALGTRLSREQMLLLALMSSENRAASALARNYPGGHKAFIAAMNVKARMVGMNETRFFDATGLDPRNVSSARDLVKLVTAASSYPLIREFSTTPEQMVDVSGGQLRYRNSNALVRNGEWNIALSKTGFIREAGRCLVMQAWLRNEPVIVVLMDADSRGGRLTDARRLFEWFERYGKVQLALRGT